MSDSISAPLGFCSFLLFFSSRHQEVLIEKTLLENYAYVVLRRVNVKNQNNFVSFSGKTGVYIITLGVNHQSGGDNHIFTLLSKQNNIPIAFR